MHTIFIYGTLKRGDVNAHYLSGAAYLGDAVTRDAAYTMLAVDDPGCDYPYPAVISGGHSKIKGEVYRVDDETLSAIDTLEELGTDYTREIVTLEYGQEAWMYVFLNAGSFTTSAQHQQLTTVDNCIEWVSF